MPASREGKTLVSWWKIRPFERQDYDAVCEILSDGLEYQQALNRKENYRAESLDEFRDDLLNNPRNQWWVALDGERVVGVMFMDLAVDQHNFRERCVLIKELDVAGAYRRRGVGTCLVEYAESFAISRGIRLLSARTHDGNTSAGDFYLAQGFTFSDIPWMYGGAPSRVASFHKRLPD
jgi:GNAT superfamily N-acetyltransferase